MTTRLLKQGLAVSLALYTLAILTSMAGMEIFGWLSALLTIALMVKKQARLVPLLKGDWALLALFGVVVLGALFNTPPPRDLSEIIGSFRFVILFLLLRIGLATIWSDRVEKWSWVLIGVAGLIGLYGTSQHWTGLDILRGDSHRAVQIFEASDAGVPSSYRAAGLLSSPITYGYSAGLFVCFSIALFALGFVQRWRGAWLVGLAALAGVSSIIASMTRGAWVGVGAAVLVMAFYLGRRVAASVVLAGALLVSGAVLTNATFHNRILSILSPQTKSASDRFLIWKANFQMFRDYPLLGVGYGENERLIGDYYQRLGIEGQVGHAHNNFIQFLAGTGALGFLLYLLFAGFYLYLCHRLWFLLPRDQFWLRSLALGAIGAQLVLHVGGLTECNFKDAEVNHEFMMILAVVGVVYWLYGEGKYGTLNPQTDA